MKTIYSIILLLLFGSVLQVINTNETTTRFNNIEQGKSYYEIIYYDDEETLETMLEEWKSYSQKNNVNIGFISYGDINTITFYQTLFQEELNHSIVKGTLPKEVNDYVSNYDSKNNYVKTGELGLPSDRLKCSLFFIDHVLNNANLGKVFIQAPKKETKQTKEFLSKYGQLEEYEEDSLMIVDPVQTIGMVVIICMLMGIVLLFTLLFTEMERKKISLLFVLGKAPVSIFGQLLKKTMVLQGFAIFISLVVFVILFRIFHTHLYAVSLIKAVVCILLFLAIVNAVKLPLIKRHTRNSSQNLKELSFAKGINRLNILVFFVLTAVLLVLLQHSSVSFLDAKAAKENYEIWGQAKNIYRLALGGEFDSGNSQEIYETDKKLSRLYNELMKREDVFVIDANNFGIESKEPLEFYFEDNVKEESDIYGMGGTSVYINEQYLDYNPIKSKENIKDKIIEDKNTLNVLVPEKFKSKEAFILKEMKKDFYGYKVEARNAFREKRNLPPLKTQPDDLKVNLIYVDNHQKYFTYDIMYGLPEKQNCITDPIAVILNPTMEEGFIASEMSYAVYIRNTSNSGAYQDLVPLLDKTDTRSSVVFVESVYSEVGYYASLSENTAKALFILMVLLIITLITLLLNQVYWYFRINRQHIIVHILHGKRSLEISKNFLLMNMGISVVLVTGLSIAFHSKLIFAGGLILMLINWFIIIIYSNLLMRKNLSSLKRRI